LSYSFFVLHDPATTEIFTLSLHDALPIFDRAVGVRHAARIVIDVRRCLAILVLRLPAGARAGPGGRWPRRIDRIEPVVVRVELRSEEHTSELQSRSDLVCRLLLEKKKQEH